MSAEGIKPMKRQQVHLSSTKEKAVDVGARHGEPVVLVIDAKVMYDDSCRFYITENGIWLTDFVPGQYIRVLE